MELTLSNELWLTWFSEILLSIGCLWLIMTTILSKKMSTLGPLIILMAWLCLTFAIGYRWVRVGHGPFISMYEILLSNLWSLLTIWLLTYWQKQSFRTVLVFVLPIFFLFMGWLLMTRPGETYYPATYYTLWLYIHVLLGKIFFGAMLVAVSLALGILLEPIYSKSFYQRLPRFDKIEELITQLLLLALIFDSLMLIAGAIWAQDAWGRFWAWDPLETWSFVCWLSIALLLHIRVSWKVSKKAYAWATIVIFCLAFLTFYGVPFISPAPHKGVI